METFSVDMLMPAGWLPLDSGINPPTGKVRYYWSELGIGGDPPDATTLLQTWIFPPDTGINPPTGQPADPDPKLIGAQTFPTPPNWHSTPTPASKDQVNITLVATDPQGNPISSVQAGQAFVLHEYAQDVDVFHNRADWPLGTGVFAAYNNVSFDPALAHVSGTIHYAAGTFVQTGTVSDTGAINGVGAASLSFSPTGLGRWEVFSISMTATQSGPLKFSTSPDIQAGHDTLLYSSEYAVTSDQIDFGSLTLPVVAASPASAASADSQLKSPEMSGFFEFTNPGGLEQRLVGASIDNNIIVVAPLPPSSSSLPATPTAAATMLLSKRKLE